MKTKKQLGSSFSVLYYLNKSRPNQSGECPIYVRILVNSTQTAFSIKRSINPAQWSTEAGQPLGSSAKVSEIKNYMISLNTAFSNAYQSLVESFPNSLSLTALHIREKIERKDSKSTDPLSPRNENSKTAVRNFNSNYFFDAYKLFLVKEHELIGIDTSTTTVGRFDYIQKIFREYLIVQKINPDTYKLSDFDKKTVLEYSHYLKTVVKNSHNTAMKKLERLRKFIKYSVDYKLTDNNPFSEIRISFKKSKKERLTSEELHSVIEKDLSHCKRLEFVRDMFVFCCFTGLSYSDMSSLVRSQIEEQSDGSLIIYKHRVKTDEPACVPLLEQPIEILNKYADLSKMQHDDLVFNMNTNEKMNAYLKEIAIVTGISKNLTTHVARHTCASMLINNGVPLAVIQRMLGHANSSTTEIYAQLFGTQVIKEIKSVGDNFKRRGAFSRSNQTLS